MKLFKIIKEYIRGKPRIRKIIGVILIIVGLGALFTPLTPGSWLALVGLELLGLRILLYDKPTHLYNKWVGKLKFWKKKQGSNSPNLPAGR